ncbi:GroES-like protein [Atractiella rhizophila]|nr:GroES-like protein [Atractiella rhizophila]
MSLQETQLGVLSTGFKRELKKVPTYSPEKGEVLVRNVAVASNPKDWKYPAYSAQWYGKDWTAVEGNDVAGYVEEVGEGVTGYQKGDKVAGFSQMLKHSKYGAYQEFTIVPVESLFPLPSDCTFEEAATYPLGFMTAALGLFSKLQLPTPVKPASGDEKFPIVVWGASSSVGAYAVQLAKASGLDVIAVAGSSGDYAKELGADEVIDYRHKTSEEVVAALNIALGGRGKQVTRVFDTISEASSQQVIVEFLSSNPDRGTSKYATVRPLLPPTIALLPSNDLIKHHLVYIKAIHEDGANFLGTVVEGEREFAKTWYAWLGRNGKAKIKPNRVRLVPGGLGGVDEGLKLLQEGKVSGEKLVYRIEDTEALKGR